MHSPEAAKTAYKYLYLHINAYIAYTFVRLVQFCMQQYYGTSFLISLQLSGSAWCFDNILHNLQKCSQNSPDKRNYDAQINCMHPIAHEHLVHTEVGDHPKRIEDQMCTTSCPSIFIFGGIRAWAVKGTVFKFAKLNHRFIAATRKDFWDIYTRSRSFNCSSPFFD